MINKMINNIIDTLIPVVAFAGLVLVGLIGISVGFIIVLGPFAIIAWALISAAKIIAGAG